MLFRSAISIPIIRPFIMAIGTPELLAICLLGLMLVVSLSHKALFKGLVAACLGLLLATIGDEPQTGELRWTFDSFYLWDGLSLVPVALGLFAVPEMIDLGASRRSISDGSGKMSRWDQIKGMRDVFKNWWLMLRCSSIGTLLGAIPGLGANVIDWIAYGYAARVVPGAKDSFGSGDVRGVIASESSNNAKEGGALVPTLAFGVPGSASMAILLGAFLIHGIAPGPKMLDEQLDVTFTLVWTVAIANILGAGLCFLLAGQFARIAMVRAGLLVPLVFGIMIIGAYQGAKDFADLIVLFAFGVLGWVMKRLNWPRPPLILAFVLGGLMENYLFISQLRYGFEWMLKPIPLVVLAIISFLFLRPLISRLFTARQPLGADTLPDQKIAGSSSASTASRDELFCDAMMWIGVVALMVYVLVSSSSWQAPAKMMPQAIATGGLVTASVFIIFKLLGKMPAHSVDKHEPLSAVLGQIAWLLSLVFGVWLIGMLPSIALFIFSYMVFEGKTKPTASILILIPFTLGVWFLFHELLHVPWPQSVLGDQFLDLRRLSGGLI